MKYFITEYKTQEAKNDLHSLGLFCYSLRSAENNWGEISTIEEHVLINRYGSIITDEEIKLGTHYPENFLDFLEFSSHNTKVNSLCDLKNGLEDYGILDLSEKEVIDTEYNKLFSKTKDFTESIEKTSQEKFNSIIEYYNSLDDFHLIDNGGHIYQLIHIIKENSVG